MPEARERPDVPSLYEWAGGAERLKELFTKFYELVARDPLLSPVFEHMDPHHAEHVAAFVGEVFGGPPCYSRDHGGHPAMIRHHLGRRLTEEHRRRWVALLLRAADEVALPDDPEFRAAFVGYVEWGSRLAVLNSRDGAPEADPNAPMPTWNWGPPGGPWQG
jgi:hemoglobin